MKRDMDFIREILLDIEGQDGPQLSDLLPGPVSDEGYNKLAEHLRLLIDDAGLVTGIAAHSMAGKNWLDLKLTWDGHEFLDTVRDDEIWARTKQGALAAGGFSLDLLAALAKGFVKKQIEEKTGVEL